MRPIDADALCAEIRKAAIYKSPIPGNWWNGQQRKLSSDEIISIIHEAPTQAVQIEMKIGKGATP